MEILIAIPIVVLAAGGLGLGLVLGRGPVRGSCGGAACGSGLGCGGCPRRRAAEKEETR